MQILLKYDKPACQNYREKKFDKCNFNQKSIYRIPHIVTYETKTDIFQYKHLHNVLYFNKKIFHFSIVSQSKFSFCELYDETLQHCFYECTYAQSLWDQLRLYFSDRIALPVLNPQSAIFSFTDILDNNCVLVNHLLLIFKYNFYNSRVNNTLRFQSLKYFISQIKYIEETISENDLNTKKKKLNKWKLINHLFQS